MFNLRTYRDLSANQFMLFYLVYTSLNRYVMLCINLGLCLLYFS